MSDRTILAIMEEFFRSVIYPGMREHLATDGQTDFSVNDVWDTALDTPIVWINGNRLWSGVTWLNPTTVQISPAASVNDRVLVLVSPGTGAGYLAAATGQLLGDLDCNGQRLTNLAPSSDDEDAVRRDEMMAFLGVIAEAANFLKRDGSLPMTGPLNFGNQHGTNVPTAAITDDSNNGGRPASWEAVRAYCVAKFLTLAGGTMAGPLAMGDNKITGLAAGENAGDAVRMDQISGLSVGSTGNARYTANGSWTAPAGVTTVYAWGMAAGGGGGAGSGAAGGPGGTGGAGGVFAIKKTVVPGTEYTVTIGQPGLAGGMTGGVTYDAQDGGDTVFDDATAYGGEKGAAYLFGGADGADGTFDAGASPVSPIPQRHPSDEWADYAVGGEPAPENAGTDHTASNGQQGYVALWW